jgi:hypothetical protein
MRIRLTAPLALGVFFGASCPTIAQSGGKEFRAEPLDLTLFGKVTPAHRGKSTVIAPDAHTEDRGGFLARLCKSWCTSSGPSPYSFSPSNRIAMIDRRRSAQASAGQHETGPPGAAGLHNPARRSAQASAGQHQ